METSASTNFQGSKSTNSSTLRESMEVNLVPIYFNGSWWKLQRKQIKKVKY